MGLSGDGSNTKDGLFSEVRKEEFWLDIYEDKRDSY